MADRTPQDAMLGTATGLTGKEIMLLSRNPATVDSITLDNLIGPNSDQLSPGNHTHGLATTTSPGFLSTSDKAKIDVFDQTKLVASGGSAGQVLTKISATNFHFGWSTPTGGGEAGPNTGWVQYNTAANLASVNPSMSTGQSGYEIDTKRWKLGDTALSWNALPYQDQQLTPTVINNPGTSIIFQLRPLATQVVNFTTAPGGNVTLGTPSSGPPTGYEATMFVRITNNTAGTITILVPSYNIVGNFFDGTLAPTESIEFSIWVLHGIWYIEGGSDIGLGSITNAHLTSMANATFKGRISAGTGSPEDVTAQQARGQIDFVAPLSVTISGSTTLTKAAHQGKALICTSTLSLTVATTTDFDSGTQCVIWADGGAVTIVAGATVNTSSTLVIPQHAVGILRRTSTDDVYTLAWSGGVGTVNITGGGDFVAVDTVALMTAIAAPASGQVVYVRGRVTAYDGGEGLFHYRSTSTTTANGGTIFEKDAGGTGRWIRFTQDRAIAFFNVKWFADAPTAFTAAYNSAANGESTVLFIPRGTWTVGDVTVHHRMAFVGEGEVCKVAGNLTFIVGAQSTPPTTRGVVFMNNITFSGGRNRLFENCSFFGTITFGSTDSNYNTFLHCVWYNQNQAIVSTHGNNQNRFISCRFLVPNGATLPCVDIQNGGGWSFIGCAFECVSGAVTPFQPFLKIARHSHTFIGNWFERPDMGTSGLEDSVVFVDDSHACTFIIGAMSDQLRTGVKDFGRGNTIIGAYYAGAVSATWRGLRTNRSGEQNLTADGSGDVILTHELWTTPTVAIANVKGVTNRLVHFISATTSTVTFRVTDLAGAAAPGAVLISFYLSVNEPS